MEKKIGGTWQVHLKVVKRSKECNRQGRGRKRKHSFRWHVDGILKGGWSILGGPWSCREWREVRLQATLACVSERRDKVVEMKGGSDDDGAHEAEGELL
jgi:hypothetical protein